VCVCVFVCVHTQIKTFELIRSTEIMTDLKGYGSAKLNGYGRLHNMCKII